MTSLISRVIAEKRPIVTVLALGLLLNIVAYFAIVRPLGVKSAGAEGRAAAAANQLRAAERELTMARGLVTGKAQADEELTAFYEKVLPADLTAARRMTYASLPALARKTGVRYEARTTSVQDQERDTRLGHMSIRMVLQGDYDRLREFIYELERATQFVIIDDVTLSESLANEPLTLTVNLSTYYRTRVNGS